MCWLEEWGGEEKGGGRGGDKIISEKYREIILSGEREVYYNISTSRQFLFQRQHPLTPRQPPKPKPKNQPFGGGWP